MNTKSLIVQSVPTLLVVVLGLPFSLAGDTPNQWHSLGPDGGFVSSLAVNPNDPGEVFATSKGRVFRSTDGGLSWHRRDVGLMGTVNSIVMNPLNPNRLALSSSFSWDRLIFTTDNGGIEWRQTEFDSFEPNGTLFASSDEFILFAGTYNTGPTLMSTDGGATWTEELLPDGSYLVAVHPDDPSRRAIRNDDQLFVTSDAGATWTTCSAVNHHLAKVYYDPHNLVTIVASSHESHLSVSHDNCMTWTQRSVPGYNQGFVMIDPVRSDTMYTSTQERCYRTTNMGGTWHEFGPHDAPANIGAMGFSATHPKLLYLSTNALGGNRGLVRSSNGGESWSLTMGGFSTETAWNLVTHPGNPNLLISGISEYSWFEGRGLHQSGDGGATWSLIPGTDQLGPSLARAPSEPNILYTISVEYRPENRRAVLRSEDGGLTWSEIAPCPDFNLTTLVVDPIDPMILFAAESPSYEGGVFRSDDGGQRWIELHVIVNDVELGITSLALDKSNPGVVYTGIWRGGVVKSTDRGESWETLRAGLESGGWNPYWWGSHWSIWSITVDPSDSSRLYALSSVGPFRSTDAGESWQLIREGLGVCCQLDDSWLEPGCPGYTDPKKAAFSNPPVCYGYPKELVVDPTNSNTMYATSGLGTFFSSDGGDSWKRIDVGGGDDTPSELHIVGDGVLLGASKSSGVVKLVVDDSPPPRGGASRPGRP